VTLIKTKHQKHAKLPRRKIGRYAPNEIGLYGSNCGQLSNIAEALAGLLNPYRIGYLDADHPKNGVEAKKESLVQRYVTGKYLDVVSLEATSNTLDFNLSFLGLDLLFVNNNHHPTDAKVLVIDPKKDLSKKTDRITGVDAIYLLAGASIPSFITELLPNFEEIPVFESIAELGIFLRARIYEYSPEIKGLVLAGGKSTRMGKDKGLIDYHGQPQREYVYHLLEKFTEEVYISGRTDQQSELQSFRFIPDKYLGLGPLGGILSAFQHDPNAAWLIVACDLPHINSDSIAHLIKNRESNKYATAFHAPESEWPEPLISIWEPKMYPRALQFLSLGYSCPRKVMINSDTTLVEPLRKEEVANVNTPEELEGILNNWD